MRVVLDASTVLALYDAAPLGAKAEELRAACVNHHVVAPALLAWEVANHHARNIHAKGFTSVADAADAAFRLIERIQLRSPDPASLARTIGLANRHNLSSYDAAYLEIAAQDKETLLVTLDEKLHEAALAVLGPARALRLDGAIARLTEAGDD